MTQLPPTSPAPAAPETSGKAVASLVCSIIGFFTCPIVLHVVGIVMGNLALKDIRAAPGRLTGTGMAKTGIILGIVGLALFIIGFCIWLAAFVLFMGAAGTSIESHPWL